MQVALDAETEATLDAAQVGEAGGTEFGTAQAEVAEAKQNVRRVRHHRGDQPGRRPCGVEEFDDRHGIGFRVGGAIGEQPLADVIGHEVHGSGPFAGQSRSN